MLAALDLKEEILALKKARNAVILAHNYQTGDIQDVADYVGDSLGLAYHAKATDADVIAFCGVHFMAETAKIVNPGKIVILPDADAGCSLEQSCPAPELEAFLAANAAKNYYVIAYINCSGGVKALCDVICTSGNAVVVAHPECTQAVRLLADEVCSTEKMVTYCKNAPVKDIIVVTESGMLHRLRKECPDKNLIAGPTDRCACADCRYMKMNTLQKLRDCLATLQPRVEMEESLRKRAELPLLRMLEQSK